MSIFHLKNQRVLRNDTGSELLLHADSPFAVKEAYKALRTNVIFSLPGSTAKCIGITSASPCEGKSTNSINLAISFAEIGKRVILVDCDMRLPTVATKLGIQSQPGLSDILVNETGGQTVIHRVKHLGIDVLPAGNISPDPTGLLESSQFDSLVKELKKHYEYILFDLPPVTTVPDGIILSKFIDAYLLLVRHKQTERKAIAEMIKSLRFVDAKILGVIYCGTSVDGHHYYNKKGYEHYAKQTSV